MFVVYKYTTRPPIFLWLHPSILSFVEPSLSCLTSFLSLPLIPPVSLLQPLSARIVHCWHNEPCYAAPGFCQSTVNFRAPVVSLDAGSRQ